MKELEDHNWFPGLFRNFQTDFIGFVASHSRLYNPFIQHIQTLPLPSKMKDLCSGSGEPAIYVFNKSNRFKLLYLGDKYPHPRYFKNDNIIYERNSEDVLEMEFKAGNCYTMFNALHHFSDEDKIRIAKKIQASGSVAFLVEILEPDIICLVEVVFMGIAGNILLSPFIKPFSFKRLFFTYILPLNVINVTIDGIISVIKSRSLWQYRRLFSAYGDKIKVFKLKSGLRPLNVIQIQS